MSDPDAYTIESYLEANGRSVPMREMANSVLKHRMQNLLRQSTTKPSEQMLPLNPTNRQHQLLHKLAVEEKSLPQHMRAKPTNKRSFNKAFNNRSQQRRGNKKSNNHNQSFNSSANAAASNRHSNGGNKQFAGTQRPTARPGRPKSNGSRGQSFGNNNQANTSAVTNASSKSIKAQQPASTSAQAVDQLKNSYDYSKIADRLDHFGSTTADVQLMLQHQLVQRSIDIAPNPKKPSKPISAQ